MKFYKGTLQPYKTLRTLGPSVYYLEEFCYKVLSIKLDTTGNIFVGDDNVTGEGKITLNFPEFLDVSVNLDLVKSVHFNFDSFIDDVENVTTESQIKRLLKLNKENPIGTRLPFLKPFPEGMLRTFFGYRYTLVRDPNKLLYDTQSLCCRKLAELSDDCFIWTEIEDSGSLNLKTYRPTVCKYKVEVDLDLLVEWMLDTLDVTSLPEAVRFFSVGKEVMGFNIICHPPYQGRMSFKDNLKVLYPNKTVKLKILDKVVFRTNKSYLENNKTYEIAFIDNDTDQILFSYSSATDSQLFSSSLRAIDTSQINSYMDDEIKTFDDGVVVNFSIPSSIQSFLGNHRNYRIRVISKDLTTHNRG